MYNLEFVKEHNELKCINVNAPLINSESIDLYADRILVQVNNFTADFIQLLKKNN